jgi:hypothetical protein
VVTARWHRGAKLSSARWPGISGGAGELGRLVVWNRADSRGPVDRETWERRPARKARTKREDVFPVKTQPTHRLDGPTGTVLACRGSAASGLAGLRGRMGHKVGRAEIKKKNSELKIGFLNLQRLWKFVEGDLGGILT